MSQVETESLIALISLPDHLRQTDLCLMRHPYATAQDIAMETKRARAVESSYLNQLRLMGLARKIRKGRTCHFIPIKHMIPNAVIDKIRRMPGAIRRILCEDMTEALVNRVNVLSKVRSS